MKYELWERWRTIGGSVFGLELWRSEFHYVSFYAEGDIRIQFSLLERFTQALYISFLVLYFF